jgi:SWI/SNF-related matrix-associated actin-dependent regulator 1 of chromatin subfamily A
MIITETNKGYEVQFPFDMRLKEAIKRINGSWYRGQDQTWIVPKHRVRELDSIKTRFGFSDVNNAAVDIPEQKGAAFVMPELDIELNLVRKLFPFQESGVAYCRQHKKVIIGDQPGLGKTCQLIAAVVSLSAFPCLVVCPATLKLNWQKEWMDVAGERAMILNDSVKHTWPQYYKTGMVKVFITNYESLKKFFVQSGWSKPKEGPFKFTQIPLKENVQLFKSIAVDESHKCKDGTTQQTKFVMAIARNKEYVFELTGTPVVNKPKDLIPQLHIVDRLRDVVSHIPQPVDRHGKPLDYSGYTRFMNRYCGGGQGATNLSELNHRLTQHCFYRREKTEVLKDLPSKLRQVVLCEISNRDEYRKAETEFVDYLKSVKGCTDAEVKKKLRGEVMVKMGILKNISARGKMSEVKEWVDEIVESGEKIILFCHLKEIGRQLREFYPSAVSITGDDSTDNRQLAVTRFQNDPKVQVIICSIKAAGVGITLTASSRVAFIEFPWTFADCEQCEDRAHRIGQKDSVQCAYFLGENTIDRYCYELIQKKKTMAQTITGSTDDVQEEIIDQLLNLFNQV